MKVIGSGVANDASVLTTTMQKFDGSERGRPHRRHGQHSQRHYDGEDSPAFATQSNAPELAEWLEPSAYIESDRSVNRR